ncbi:uncharacterized protein PF3D7_1120000 [Drosophila takahashii]|uniref:uncharacterized protein PF3D7_1120000 n=1 Tax=Drosophila takahashii TaxID=29030 RepID=UPI001CF8292F|nr:uncharacterized protein LOC108055968 [Drosophila takahashii]
MEETEISENKNLTQADKMKPASAHGEHKELYLLSVSDSEDSLGQMGLDKKKLSTVKNLKMMQSNVDDLEQSRQAKEKTLDVPQNNMDVQEKQKIESEASMQLSKAEENVEISGTEEDNIRTNLDSAKVSRKDSKELSQEQNKTEISGTKDENIGLKKASEKTIPKKPKVPSQAKLRDAVSNRQLNKEEKSQNKLSAEDDSSPQKSLFGEIKADEENRKTEHQAGEEILKSIPEKPVKGVLNAKEQDTIPKPEHFQQTLSYRNEPTASTSSSASDSIKDAEKPNKIEMKIDPRNKIKKDMEEYFSGIQALEVKKKLHDEMNAKEAEAILKEEQRRKTWKEMLSEVGRATSLSTSTHSTSTGRPPRSVVVAILQRTAKAEYKRKLTILQDNFKYRLGLIKQLKHDMKNNFKSEAQQLYCDYHTIKNQTQNQPTLNEMYTVYSKNSHEE